MRRSYVFNQLHSAHLFFIVIVPPDAHELVLVEPSTSN